MGANATIFVFDYLRYRDEVVPEFVRLVCERGWALGRKFPDCCRFLDAELAVRQIARIMAEEGYHGGWESRACRETDCPLRETCGFHSSRGSSLPSDLEDAFWALEKAIAERCLGPGQFLGRSVDCSFYWDTLDVMGVPPEDPVRHLLEKLGRRGRLIGYRGCSGTEGIHGWLSPEETAQLGRRLERMRLPAHAQSFPAMALFLAEFGKSAKPLWMYRNGSVEPPQWSFEEVSLCFVRTVCLLASREGRGVLWGNDVSL